MTEEKEAVESPFELLFRISAANMTDKKGNLTYLSWAKAWGELKKNFPNANCKVYEKDDGRIYWDDGKTAWVKVSVTIGELEHIEYLPIMNYKNQAVPVNAITSMDANKSIQRALTKAIARHGLGLYIYAGEDLPEPPSQPTTQVIEEQPRLQPKSSQPSQAQKGVYFRLLGELHSGSVPAGDIEDAKKMDETQMSNAIDDIRKELNS